MLLVDDLLLNNKELLPPGQAYAALRWFEKEPQRIMPQCLAEPVRSAQRRIDRSASPC
jgi:hypothetical protein